MSDTPITLEQAIDEAMVQALSPVGGREYMEAVRKLKRLENAARAKAQEVMSHAETFAETALVLWDCEAEIERARAQFLSDLRAVMAREAEHCPPPEQPRLQEGDRRTSS